MKIRIERAAFETQIILGQEAVSSAFCELCYSLGKKVALFADSSLPFASPFFLFLKSQGLDVELFLVPPGEKAKTREVKEALEDSLLERRFGRDSLFLALGGGATTDLIGFLASTYLRGVPLVLLPTTLLAMVDASIGAKTAVDTPFGKNLIGTFYAPKAIWMDLTFLGTLPRQEWLGGLAEALKMGLISDLALWEEVEKQGLNSQDTPAILRLIERAAAAKIHIVERDPEERDLRAILNFGHTVAHAIEQASGYSWSHGQAVAIGCVGESWLSHHLGHLPLQDFERIVKLFSSLGYPLGPLPDNLLEPMRRDKKNQQSAIHFILLQKIGQVFSPQQQYSHAVGEREILSMLSYLQQLGT